MAMITVAKLRHKPHQFRTLTGLSVAEFDSLLAEFAPAYGTARFLRRCSAGRKREPGAGRPFALRVDARLLMALIYFRLYISQRLLSLLCDLDQSSVSRELMQRVLPVLEGILPVPLRDTPLSHWAKSPEPDGRTFPVPVRKGKRISTLKELLTAFPERQELLLDAPEQPVPQPTEKHPRKLAFSGKQHDHTIKTQIVATKTRILYVCGELPGSVHDLTVLGGSGVLLAISKTVKVRLDRGVSRLRQRQGQARHPVPHPQGTRLCGDGFWQSVPSFAVGVPHSC